MPMRRGNPGETIPLTLYWQALSKMSKNYVIFNHLLDSQQRNWGGYDRWPQETSKTTLWRPGEIVIDTFNMPIAAEAPDGIYTIDIGLYAQDDPQARSLALLHNGAPTGQNSVRLGIVKIGGPPPELVIPQVAPGHRVDAVFGDVIRMNGFDKPGIEPGQLQLQLYWESLAETGVDYTLFVHVQDQAGNLAAQMDRPPVNGSYPTSLWSSGEIIPDVVTVPLPEKLPPGKYSVVMGLYNLADGARLALPGSADNSLRLMQFVAE